MDTDYFLDEETIQDGSLLLLGLAGLTSLEYNQTSRNWKLASLKEPSNPENGIMNGTSFFLLGFKSLYLKDSWNYIRKFEVKISKASTGEQLKAKCIVGSLSDPVLVLG